MADPAPDNINPTTHFAKSASEPLKTSILDVNDRYE